MNRNEPILQEQAAPEKNTDNAFVQVGTDGQPQLPGEQRQNDTQQEDLVEQQEPAK